MAFSDSMFLFEVLIQDFKSFTVWKQAKMFAQFADVFKVPLKCPAETKKLRMNPRSQKGKLRKGNNVKLKKSESKMSTYTSQSILILKKLPELIALMKKYPMEIHLIKDMPSDKNLGSTIIPWSDELIYYLTKNLKSEIPSASMQGKYNVYNEITSQVIATIDISLKLFHIKDKKFNHYLCTEPVQFIGSKKYNLVNVESIRGERAKISEEVLIGEMHLAVNANQTSNIPNSFESTAYTKNNKTDNQRICCIRSDLELSMTKSKCNENIVSVKSSSSLCYKQNNNLYRYIFGDPNGIFGNKVYRVGYLTVRHDTSGQSSPKRSSGAQSPPKDSSNVRSPQKGSSNAQSPQKGSSGDQITPQDGSGAQSSDKSSVGRKKLTFKKCESSCKSKIGTASCPDSICTIDLPEEVAHVTSVTKCEELTCNYNKHRELPPSPDDRILLNVSSVKSDCCTTLKQSVVEGVITKMKIGHDPCFCDCECSLFRFNETTYCTICGGYEMAGDDVNRKPAHEAPIPCPIYHKLVDKNKLKTLSTSGSESKRRGDDQRSLKGSTSLKVTADKKSLSEKKSVESEKDKKKKKYDRFKFNYGYKAPQIGHSQCALPCSGTLDNVPKRMGWLWSAENVLGIKFRPLWKPGAINKHVLRLLRMARHPGQIMTKKKRKDLGKKKRPLKRPLLVVHKRDGEFTVTMETMKTFTKPRALNQQPYEDKPVVTYIIGRTEEENRERLKRKERKQRRLERAQRQFIQSTFRDMCQEICLKTYQQALGILPDAEDPECTCYPALPNAKDINLDLSCSCSEDESSFVGSDTDSDEWFVEFTPPNATFNPLYKGKKVLKIDNGSQYSYLDYKVKLLDRFGNPIPRFFKGPDGKQQCSDLGGFWSPDHKWLEINVDGYIAPDGRWAPMTFIGPNGEQVDAETGKFQAMNGKWLVVGVDGFVDSQGKWKFYPTAAESRKRRHVGTPVARKERTGDTNLFKNDEWSCFGDASPRILSELGIVGHGEDRKLLLMRLQKILERGEGVTIPERSTVYRLPIKKRRKGNSMKFSRSFVERYKCHHPVPSYKGIVAVDDHGRKAYFRLKDHMNRRPNERMTLLTEQGISLSSFHVPCFHSFINSEVMKHQLRERLIARSNKTEETQMY